MLCQGPFTVEDLLSLRCDTPNCKEDHIVMHLGSNCHPGAPMQVWYNKTTETLFIECDQCHRHVLRIKVARRVRTVVQ
jgi:hypothetical protein